MATAHRTMCVLASATLLLAACGSDDTAPEGVGANPADDTTAAGSSSTEHGGDRAELGSGVDRDADGSDGRAEEGSGVDCRPTTSGVDRAETDAGPFPWDAGADAAVLEGFDTSEVVPGGPPPDGIQPVDAPCVVDVEDADQWLVDDESVLLVEVGGAVRAYPIAMMTQHEIVNDVLGGTPLAVTYCPLCNSGLAFERTRDGQTWDFGTSGRLLRSNLVMYDRQTRTLWSQFTGQALWGDPAVVGAELVRVPTQLLGWATVRESFPEATVLGRDSVPGRTYGRNPYPGLEDDPSAYLFRGELDDRLEPGDRVVGIGEGDRAVAVPLDALRDQRVVSVPAGDRTVTVLWAPGQASALDDSEVAGGREVGQTGAFLVDGLEAVEDGRFRDPATGATHDVTGRVVEGNASSLEAVALDDTFWFVWFAFQPDTRVAG